MQCNYTTAIPSVHCFSNVSLRMLCLHSHIRSKLHCITSQNSTLFIKRQVFFRQHGPRQTHTHTQKNDYFNVNELWSSKNYHIYSISSWLELFEQNMTAFRDTATERPKKKQIQIKSRRELKFGSSINIEFHCINYITYNIQH